MWCFFFLFLLLLLCYSRIDKSVFLSSSTIIFSCINSNQSKTNWTDASRSIEIFIHKCRIDDDDERDRLIFTERSSFVLSVWNWQDVHMSMELYLAMFSSEQIFFRSFEKEKLHCISNNVCRLGRRGSRSVGSSFSSSLLDLCLELSSEFIRLKYSSTDSIFLFSLAMNFKEGDDSSSVYYSIQVLPDFLPERFRKKREDDDEEDIALPDHRTREMRRWVLIENVNWIRVDLMVLTMN